MQIAPLSCPTAVAAPDPKLRKAAEGFEALFVSQLLATARAAKLSDGLVSSNAIDTSQDMLDRQMADATAGKTHLGIAEALLRQFSSVPGKARPCP